MGPEADLISTQVQKTKLLKEPDTLQMSFFFISSSPSDFFPIHYFNSDNASYLF